MTVNLTRQNNHLENSGISFIAWNALHFTRFDQLAARRT